MFMQDTVQRLGQIFLKNKTETYRKIYRLQNCPNFFYQQNSSYFYYIVIRLYFKILDTGNRRRNNHNREYLFF